MTFLSVITDPDSHVWVEGANRCGPSVSSAFWGGPIDDQALGVFLIEGAGSVSNAAGEQIRTGFFVSAWRGAL
jgi:hypothetical protein